jgi:hypothetical protein
MPAGWVAAGVALVGAAASYAGSKKQADATKKGAGQQMAMFDTLNKQQQPYIQSGYGATQKLNTLLGIGGGGSAGGSPSVGSMTPQNNAYRPTPSGGVQQIVGPSNFGAPPDANNLRLKQILSMRAQRGDTEAQHMLEQV